MLQHGMRCLVFPALWSGSICAHLLCLRVCHQLPLWSSKLNVSARLSLCAQVFGLLLAVCLGSFVSALGAVLMLWL